MKGDKTHRILVVDDVVENIDILMATLKTEYKISAATDGEKALEVANSKSPPDLVLLDIMMPGLDGYEVCRQLKSNEATKNIPIIFLTALNEDKNEAKGLQLGAVDYIAKPFNPDLVKTRVRNHLELKDHRDHLEDLVRDRTSQLHEANEKIKTASLDTIYRLARAAEYKDQDTGVHIRRMAHYAVALSRELGIDEDRVESISYAAPMHDIGKLGIPDHILLKPGALTEEEFAIIQQHTIIGAKILANSDSAFIKEAEIIALAHHEKWDGSGYPHKLKGMDIPLVGGIAAVSDVFDALTARRPYKEPFSVEKSLGIIKEGRGSHFNPDIVDALLNIVDEIVSIKEQFQNQDGDLPIPDELEYRTDRYTADDKNVNKR
ncbi:MAG: HD domain-containing phosphohydrolase [Desulfobacterales bacterium]